MGALFAIPSTMDLFRHGILVVVSGIFYELSGAIELFHHGLSVVMYTHIVICESSKQRNVVQITCIVNRF